MAANPKQTSDDTSFKIVTGGLVAAIVLFSAILVARGCYDKAAHAKQDREVTKKAKVAEAALAAERAKLPGITQSMKLVVADAKNYDGRKLVPSVQGEHNVATMPVKYGPVEVVEPTGPAPTTPLALGKQLYTTKACLGCHSLTGAKMAGPSFKGIFGKEEEMADGTKITVDEAYLKESILDPNAKIVKGFAPAMPPYKGQLDEKQLAGLIEFIKAQK